MDIALRRATESEQMYAYSQSEMINGISGCYGHLRADFDRDGNSFFTSWDNHGKPLYDDAFKAEFDHVINTFRKDPTGWPDLPNGQLPIDCFLQNRKEMQTYCSMHPECKIAGTNGREYALRADTKKYSYILRLNPNRGEYNLYCYCYQKELLDRHLREAEKGIRIIDPQFNMKFQLEDGDKLRMTTPDGNSREQTCRVIDSCHFELGTSAFAQLFHISEFAQYVEEKGCTLIPIRESLPEACYSVLQSTGEIILLKRGEQGYFKTDIPVADATDARTVVDSNNRKIGVSKAQEAAMVTGSMFGFDVPGADPKRYDSYGKPVRSTKHTVER